MDTSVMEDAEVGCTVGIWAALNVLKRSKIVESFEDFQNPKHFWKKKMVRINDRLTQ